ncbi:MAG TPA: sigma-70 family RNA polymerase sigma factor [Ktedonobacterales bacterium]|nr:sigma-70 family RNA polymerase sigma factor [Ktedonobacterales bacterium]
MAEQTERQRAGGLNDPAPPTDHAAQAMPGDELTALIELARSGDREAFAALMGMHERQVRIFLAQLTGDDEQARDLTQDVFVRVWDRIGELRETASYRSWLFRLATNVARSALRRRRLLAWISLDRPLRRHQDTTPDSRPLESLLGPAPESGFDERLAETQALAAALRHVPLEYRACLLLHAGLGFSVAEVARQLDLTPGAVRMRLHRGLALLREAYLREGGEVP